MWLAEQRHFMTAEQCDGADISAVPVFLLPAACVVLVLVRGLNAQLDETTPTQAGEPTQQTTPRVSRESIESRTERRQG